MAKINFLKTAFLGAFVKLDDITNPPFAEFMLLGRSNVGKSSLINALTRKAVAKTSSTPGKTETINHYTIDEQISLFDLPGYGYAKFKTKRVGWSEFIDAFIEKKGNQLKAFLVLIDVRHALSEEDKTLLQYLNRFSSPLVIIFTKIDKLNSSELKRHTETLAKEIEAHYTGPLEYFNFSIKLPLTCKQLEHKIGIWAK